MVVTELCELEDEHFEVRDYQRPPGYSATSRVHVGRLCVPTLHDSGATCCCITEEQVVLIVNHTQRMLAEGLISIKDYNYPIVQFYWYKNLAYLTGAHKTGKMVVEYAVV